MAVEASNHVGFITSGLLLFSLLRVYGRSERDVSHGIDGYCALNEVREDKRVGE